MKRQKISGSDQTLLIGGLRKTLTGAAALFASIPCFGFVYEPPVPQVLRGNRRGNVHALVVKK